MSPNNTPHKQPAPVESDHRLSDSQIMEQKPKLFEPEFYLERLPQVLDEFRSVKVRVLHEFGLEDPEYDRFQAHVSGLADRIIAQLADVDMEFGIEHHPFDFDPSQVIQEHPISVRVANTNQLLNSADQPLQELEGLHQLFSFVRFIQSEIERIQRSLVKLQDHKRKYEEKLSELTIELNRLEDEIAAAPSRPKFTQKEQLEKDLSKVQQDLSKESKKANQKKRRIADHEQKLKSVVQAITAFLSQHKVDPETNFFDQLDLEALAQEVKITLPDIGIQSHIRKVLETERKGAYVTMNRIAQFKEWVIKRRLLIDVVIFILIVAGAGYKWRDKIADVVKEPAIPSPTSPSSTLSPPPLPPAVRHISPAKKSDLLDPDLVEKFKKDPFIAKYADEADKRGLLGMKSRADTLRFTKRFIKRHLSEIQDDIGKLLDSVPPVEVRSIYDAPLFIELFEANGVPYDESTLALKNRPDFYSAFSRAFFESSTVQVTLDVKGDGQQMLLDPEKTSGTTLNLDNYCRNSLLTVITQVVFPNGLHMIPIRNISDLHYFNRDFSRDKCNLVFDSEARSKFDRVIEAVVAKEPPVCYVPLNPDSNVGRRLNRSRRNLRQYVFVKIRPEFFGALYEAAPDISVSLKIMYHDVTTKIGLDNTTTYSLTIPNHSLDETSVIVNTQIPLKDGSLVSYTRYFRLKEFKVSSGQDCRREGDFYIRSIIH